MIRYAILPLCGALLIHGCASQTPAPEPTPEPTVPVASTPNYDSETLSDLLVAEVAAQRQSLGVTLGYYSQAAESTRDPAVISQAAQLAHYLEDPQQALAMSELWLDTTPDSEDALQVAILSEIRLGNTSAATRHLDQLLSAHGEDALGRLVNQARGLDEQGNLQLVEALAQLQVDVTCPAGTGCPPVSVASDGLSGGRATLAGDTSSQFLSALLMIAPAAAAPITLVVDGPLVSRPYVDMTVALMDRMGADVVEDPRGSFTVSPTGYNAIELDIEPDASAASYFLAAAAVTGGRVTVEGLGSGALQGDVAFVDCLARMGCTVEATPEGLCVTGGDLVGIDVDMNTISDTAQTLAVVAAFATGPTRIRGIAHVRHKETDRVTAMVTELERLGLAVDQHDDGLTIHPGPLSGGEIQTYDDHRMAMSFAVAGLASPGIVIADPDCTAKTYPGFFDDLERLCGDGR